MMADTERMSTLIGSIYDATLDPAQWSPALTALGDYVGGQAVGLLSKDSVSLAGDAHFHVGVEERYLEAYRTTYWQFDPLSPLLFFPVGQVTASADVLDPEAFYRSRFYLEWAKPQGFVDAANVVLEKAPTSCAILSVIRAEAAGPVDDEMRHRMDLAVPHVRRAILIGRALDLKTAEAASLADTLDGLGAGAFLINASGHIVHANRAGQVMTTAGGLFDTANGRLATGDAEADRTLAAVLASARDGDTAVGLDGIAVPVAGRDGILHVAHILPLTSGARRQAGIAYAAVAAVFVRKAALDTPAAPEAIAKAYRLTPTELRVILAIVDVGGVPEVADALGIGEATVKTHLGRVYEKTGARRQADLVRLVAGFANPLAS